jgi:acetyltransferase, GNAT family
MVYLIKNDIMHIKEMIYLNREAKKGLWEYIHAHDSMIDAVHGYTYFSEPIAFEMDDGDIKETIRPYAMGRIIDIESFLQDYPCDPDGGTLYIELEIEDHLLLWNNRSFRLCFSDGTCMLTDEPAEYKLKMEIGTLTTLLLGYKTAERLYALERIEGKQEAVDRLDDVLFHKIPYISDYI